MRKLCLLAMLTIGFGSPPPAVYASLWSSVPAAERALTAPAARFAADDAALRERLALAPHEVLLDRSHTLELPMPDGSLQRFSVVESPIMPAATAERFPEMKTFRLRGIDDPAVSGRADITTRGFRAMLSTPAGVVFIDPESPAGNLYRAYLREPTAERGFSCGVHAMQQSPLAHVPRSAASTNRVAGNLQTYRIAVSATQEYVLAIGGSSAARAEILTAINRVNQFYERDLGIRLLLVANDGGLLEGESDSCFSNDDETAMVLENQAWIDDRIGSSAYDIGHVFGTGAGSVARLGSACQAGAKAGGVSRLPNPRGDPFYIDYVAHEIGHQLNADHSFNGTTGSCETNRNAATAVEPGSGSTIMGYAGLCGLENLQFDSDTTFHATSISQIDAFTASGGSCYGTVFNGNRDPAVAPLVDRTIPAQTPFRLAAAASDPDSDTLSYQWDQMDTGDATNGTTFGSDLGNNPLFRSYAPRTESFRDFPALGTQLRGLIDRAEVLPDAARTLDFRVTVRDGNSGQAHDDLRLTVVGGTGFRIIAPNGGQLDTTAGYTVTWNTADTEIAPVNCASVDIDLLTFNNAAYTRYSVHSIAAGVDNDGSAVIPNPLDRSHPRARLRVMCSDNLFYDISDSDLQVIGTSTTLLDDEDFATFFNTSVITASREPASRGGLVDPFAAARGQTAARVEDCRSASINGDASALEPLWLLTLAGLAALARLRRRYGLQ